MDIFNKIHSAVKTGMAIKSAITVGAGLIDGGASALGDWLLTKMISVRTLSWNGVAARPFARVLCARCWWHIIQYVGFITP